MSFLEYRYEITTRWEVNQCIVRLVSIMKKYFQGIKKN